MLAYRMVDVFLLKEGSMNNLFHIMALVRDRPLFKLVVVGKLICTSLLINYIIIIYKGRFLCILF